MTGLLMFKNPDDLRIVPHIIVCGSLFLGCDSLETIVTFGVIRSFFEAGTPWYTKSFVPDDCLEDEHFLDSGVAHRNGLAGRWANQTKSLIISFILHKALKNMFTFWQIILGVENPA